MERKRRVSKKSWMGVLTAFLFAVLCIAGMPQTVLAEDFETVSISTGGSEETKDTYYLDLPRADGVTKIKLATEKPNSASYTKVSFLRYRHDKSHGYFQSATYSPTVFDLYFVDNGVGEEQLNTYVYEAIDLLMHTNKSTYHDGKYNHSNNVNVLKWAHTLSKNYGTDIYSATLHYSDQTGNEAKELTIYGFGEKASKEQAPKGDGSGQDNIIYLNRTDFTPDRWTLKKPTEDPDAAVFQSALPTSHLSKEMLDAVEEEEAKEEQEAGAESHTSVEVQTTSVTETGVTRIDQALAQLFAALFDLMKRFNTGIITVITDNISTAFAVKPESNFYPLFGNVGDGILYKAFTLIGASIAVLIIMLALYFCMVSPSSHDTPIRILLGGIVSVAGVFLSGSLMRFINRLFFGDTGLGGMSGLFTFGKDIPLTGTDASGNRVYYINALYTDPDLGAGSGLSELGLSLLSIVATIIMMIQLFKLLIEVMERWILMNLYNVLSPIAIAMYASELTADVTRTFFMGYFTQSFIMVMNLWFISIFKQIIVNLYTYRESMHELTGWTTFLFCVLLIGILQACAKLDNYLADMGFTVARTGGRLASTIVMGTIGIASTFGYAAKTAAGGVKGAKDLFFGKGGGGVSSGPGGGGILNEMQRHQSYGGGVGDAIAHARAEKGLGKEWAKTGETISGSAINKVAQKTGQTPDLEMLRQSARAAGKRSAKVDDEGAAAVLTASTSASALKGASFAQKGNTMDVMKGEGSATLINGNGETTQAIWADHPFELKDGTRGVNVAPEGEAPLYLATIDGAPVGGTLGYGMEEGDTVSYADYVANNPGSLDAKTLMGLGASTGNADLEAAGMLEGDAFATAVSDLKVTKDAEGALTLSGVGESISISMDEKHYGGNALASDGINTYYGVMDYTAHSPESVVSGYAQTIGLSPEMIRDVEHYGDGGGIRATFGETGEQCIFVPAASHPSFSGAGSGGKADLFHFDAGDGKNASYYVVKITKDSELYKALEKGTEKNA